MRKPKQQGKIPHGPHPRSNNMTPHIPEEFSTRLIDWSPFVIMGNTMPPRDPDEDGEDEEEEDRADEPPVVREPDERAGAAVGRVPQREAHAASELLLEFIGFPISRSFTTYCVCLELRSLPSTGVTRLPRYYEPLRHFC